MRERLAGNWFQGFRVFTSESEASNQYLWWTAATILAASLRRRVWCKWNYEPIYPNLYVMLVGPPGSRKSRAISFARQFGRHIELPIAAEATSKEGLIYHMMKHGVLQEMGPNIYDTSPLIITSSDFMSLYRTSKESMVEWLTDLYDTEQYEEGWKYEVRSRDPELIPKPYINMIAGTTPSWMSTNLGEAFTEQGFSARTVFVYAGGPRFLKSRPIITPEMWDMHVRLIADLKHIATLYGELHTSTAAWEWFSHWYEEIHPNEKVDYRLAHYMTRKPLHLWKLASIITISESDEMVITKEYFEVALAQLNSIEPLMLRAFSGVGRNPIAGRMYLIYEDIKAAAKGMSKGQLAVLHSDDLTAAQLDEALQSLTLMKKIAPNSISNGDILYTATGERK